LLSCKVGKKQINAFDYKKESLRKYSHKGLLKCPVCNEELIYKHGMVKTRHFAHKKENDCNFGQTEPETEEHSFGKKYLYKWLKSQFLIYEVELEKWLPEIKIRPDIWFKDKNGKEYIIEYQCSPITLEYKVERNNLYELNNITPIWIYGLERISPKSSFASFRDYFFDPEELLFYKDGFVQKFKKMNNFYFEDGEIFVNDEIRKEFKGIIRTLTKEKEDLLKRQQDIFDKTMGLIKRERRSNRGKTHESKHDELIAYRNEEIRKEELRKDNFINHVTDNLYGKTITVFNDVERYRQQKNQGVMYSSKGNKVTIYKLCSAIKKSNVLHRDSFNMYIPITLGKSGQKFLESNFPDIDFIYKRGVKG